MTPAFFVQYAAKFLTALATAAATAVTLGVFSSREAQYVAIGLAFLGAIGVYAVPNKLAPTMGMLKMSEPEGNDQPVPAPVNSPEPTPAPMPIVPAEPEQPSEPAQPAPEPAQPAPVTETPPAVSPGSQATEGESPGAHS